MVCSTGSSPLTKKLVLLNFAKYHGSGNDFILIESIEVSLPFFTPEKIRQLCHRRYGVGGDGIIFLEPSEKADVRMHIFNADGSKASMCGNALRCTAKHLGLGRSLLEIGEFLIEATLLGECILTTVPIEKARVEKHDFPCGLTGYSTCTGTEHLVVILGSFDEIDFLPVASTLRASSIFSPKGVNVNFVTLTEGKILARTYEKGVEAETFSCGTGGAAISLVLKKVHNYSEGFTISWQSGEEISYRFDKEERLWMAGPACRVFSGTFTFQKKMNFCDLEV